MRKKKALETGRKKTQSPNTQADEAKLSAEQRKIDKGVIGLAIKYQHDLAVTASLAAIEMKSYLHNVETSYLLEKYVVNTEIDQAVASKNFFYILKGRGRTIPELLENETNTKKVKQLFAKDNRFHTEVAKHFNTYPTETTMDLIVHTTTTKQLNDVLNPGSFEWLSAKLRLSKTKAEYVSGSTLIARIVSEERIQKSLVESFVAERWIGKEFWSEVKNEQDWQKLLAYLKDKIGIKNALYRATIARYETVMAKKFVAESKPQAAISMPSIPSVKNASDASNKSGWNNKSNVEDRGITEEEQQYVNQRRKSAEIKRNAQTPFMQAEQVKENIIEKQAVQQIIASLPKTDLATQAGEPHSYIDDSLVVGEQASFIESEDKRSFVESDQQQPVSTISLIEKQSKAEQVKVTQDDNLASFVESGKSFVSLQNDDLKSYISTPEANLRSFISTDRDSFVHTDHATPHHLPVIGTPTSQTVTPLPDSFFEEIEFIVDDEFEGTEFERKKAIEIFGSHSTTNSKVVNKSPNVIADILGRTFGASDRKDESLSSVETEEQKKLTEGFDLSLRSRTKRHKDKSVSCAASEKRNNETVAIQAPASDDTNVASPASFIASPIQDQKSFVDSHDEGSATRIKQLGIMKSPVVSLTQSPSKGAISSRAPFSPQRNQ